MRCARVYCYLNRVPFFCCVPVQEVAFIVSYAKIETNFGIVKDISRLEIGVRSFSGLQEVLEMEFCFCVLLLVLLSRTARA